MTDNDLLYDAAMTNKDSLYDVLGRINSLLYSIDPYLSNHTVVKNSPEVEAAIIQAESLLYDAGRKLVEMLKKEGVEFD